MKILLWKNLSLVIQITIMAVFIYFSNLTMQKCIFFIFDWPYLSQFLTSEAQICSGCFACTLMSTILIQVFAQLLHSRRILYQVAKTCLKTSKHQKNLFLSCNTKRDKFLLWGWTQWDFHARSPLCFCDLFKNWVIVGHKRERMTK